MLQFLPPKKQSDDRCVSAEKIIVQVVCQGVFVTVNNHFVGYSVRRDLLGEVRSRWVPGANGEKLRDRSTSKNFYKMINFQFIPRAEVISKGFFGSCMRLYIARRLIVCQEI